MEDTYLSQVIETVRHAQQSRSRSQNLADRAAFWLTMIAISVGLVTLAAWLLVGRQFDFALERMVTVMVITCPHALGLAVPLVVAVSTALAAGHGLLIRDRNGFERARRIDGIVFDKTGTLTEGRFAVSDVVALDGADEDELLSLAAAVESQSEHPIAQGVTAVAEERGLQWEKPSEFRAIAGKGAQAKVLDNVVKVVSPGYLKEHDLTTDHEKVRNLVALSRSTYRKMVQNLWWASGYNIVAIPLAAGVAAPWGIILPPAVGALVMSVSTVIVAINSRLLKMPTSGSDTSYRVGLLGELSSR